MIPVLISGTIQVTLEPKPSARPNDIQAYELRICYPLIDYTHTETVMASSEKDAALTARFLARSVTRELSAQLETALKELDDD